MIAELIVALSVFGIELGGPASQVPPCPKASRCVSELGPGGISIVQWRGKKPEFVKDSMGMWVHEGKVIGLSGFVDTDDRFEVAAAVTVKLGDQGETLYETCDNGEKGAIYAWATSEAEVQYSSCRKFISFMIPGGQEIVDSMRQEQTIEM